MKKVYLFLITVCYLVGGHAQNAFTPGNIVVYRVGNGIASLNDDFFKVYLDEYTSTGVFVQSIEMPSASTQKLTSLGRLPESGLITLSENGKYLVVPGFNELPGELTDAKRSVALIGVDGKISSISTFPNDNFDIITGAATNKDASGLWISGTNGVEFLSTGSSAVKKIASFNGNSSSINIVNGQLFVTNTSTPQIAKLGNGTPTTSGQTLNSLPGTITVANNPCFQFAFADLNPSIPGNDVLYLASQANSSVGGLKKYSLVDGNWTLNGTIGTSGDRYTALTGITESGKVSLFAIRQGKNSGLVKGGEIVKIIDSSGYNGVFKGTPEIIISVPVANTLCYRGVAMVPINCSQVNNLQAINITASQATIIWAKSDNNSTYEYTVDTNPDPPTASTTTSDNAVALSGLSNNVTYYAHVRTICNSSISSDWKTTSFITTCKSPENYTIVANLDDSGNCVIRWNQVFGATAYRYWISTSPIPPTDGIEVHDTVIMTSKLNAVTKYYVHIKTDCGSGAFSEWTTKAFSTGCFMPLTKITGLEKNTGVSWRRIPNASKYEYAFTNNAAKPLSGTLTIDTFYLFNKLNGSAFNYFHVRSICNTGKVSEWNTISFAIPGVIVYPNPVKDVLHLQLSGVNYSGAEISIADISGRLIQRIPVNNNNLDIHTQAWRPGLYLVHFKDGQQNFTIKVLKQ